MKDKEFQELLNSIDQARDIHREHSRPSRIFHYEPIEVKAIRKKLKLTQAGFAKLLCISLGTLRNWEQGRTYPEGAATVLLRVAEKDPQAIFKAVHSDSFTKGPAHPDEPA